MKATSQVKRTKGAGIRRIGIPIILVLLVAAGAFGYFYWTQQAEVASAQASDEGFNTSQVRRGSISLSASGSGTLIAGQEAELGFSAAGTVAEVNVEVGDIVEEGQTLAKLGNLNELQADVNAAQQALISAQEDLETLKGNAAANLANAKLAVAEAEEALLDAKSGVIVKGMARCDQESIDAYYYKYTHAKEYLDSLGDGGGNADYYLNTIVPQKNVVAQAYAAYEYCAGFADYEVSSSEATLSLAEATLEQARATLETLTENNGVDPLELATAENAVSSAELAVDEAKEILEGATLVAPFAGTILSIEGQAGDTVDIDAFITIADLAHPRIEFSADETDMDKLSVGEQATITFDAVPDRTFQGKVIRIDPTLDSSSGYMVVTGLIEMDLSQETDVPTLPKGLNATVELIQATAEDVLLVPLQAVRDLGDGTYAVFVVGDDGKPKLRVVEVGLTDAASAEIKSGVSMGEVVTTGLTETK